MTRQILISVVVLLVIGGTLNAEQPAYRPGVVLVRFANVGTQPPTTAAKNSIVNSILGGSGSPVKREYTLVQGLTQVGLPAGMPVENAVATLKQSSSILYAEPDYKLHLCKVPNDTRFGELWGMSTIGAPAAWDISTGTGSVIVAVTDTGVDYTHSDLAANMWHNPGEIPGNGIDDDGNGYIDDVYGVDTGDNDSNPMDVYGHGTHVSGTVGAVGNNAMGVAGVCWNVKIMAVKIFTDAGTETPEAFVSNAVEGIQYATAKGAKVINASWGVDYYSQNLYDAIASARDAGVIFVAAAGNETINNDSTPAYPASYDLANIISVMATTNTDQKAGFSNYGLTSVDIGAPGENILSTLPGNQYDSWAGTSMASPHVAGACALLLSIDPTLTYSQARQILLDTVDPTLPGLCASGGRLNLAAAAHEAASDTTPPTPNPAEWEVEPAATGPHAIAMMAKLASDRSGVEYFFECVTDVNKSSSWRSEPNYSPSTLNSNTAYGFRFKARDKSANHNETGWSTELFATTGVGPDDDLPPAPDPARWAIKPRVQRLTPPAIRMRAMTASDESGVEYWFEETTGTGINSGWQSSDIFTVSSGLTIGNTYTFRFKTRDKSSLHNQTGWSTVESVRLTTGPRILTVPVPYVHIQEAIDAANTGDIVEISPGTYYMELDRNLSFEGKAITVRSIAPENPDVVAATIIDCNRGYFPPDTWAKRGFIFNSGEGPSSILAGVTIINGWVKGEPSATPAPEGSGADGNDGNPAAGGGILVGPDPGIAAPGDTHSSPTIRDCVITNCVAIGGNGQAGADGNDGDDFEEGTIPASPGNDGGDGGDSGFAWGGGIYVSPGSNPTIRNCSIISCYVKNGDANDGGNGGNGGQNEDGTLQPGGNGGNGGDNQSIQGGGIYIAGSGTTVVGCTIEDCNAIRDESILAGAVGEGGQGNPPGSRGMDGIYVYTHGGGACFAADSVQVSATTFANNQSSAVGGGISCLQGTLTLADCNLTGNVALYTDYAAGGGLNAGGLGINSSYSPTVRIYRSYFANNSAGRSGGGMFLFYTGLYVENSTFVNNQSQEGGGIKGNNCTIDIHDSNITGNTATQPSGLGGGIAFWNTEGEITNCDMKGNSADRFGGAVFTDGWNDNPLKFANCLITDNSAYYEGGALSCNVGAWAQLLNCTVVNNSADSGAYGSGGGVSSAEYFAWVEINNSILWGNSATYGPQIAVGTVFGSSPDPGGPFADVDVSHSDVEGGEGQVFLEDPDYTAVWWLDGNFDADPLFANTDVNEITYYLSQVAAGQPEPDSPCVDTGDPGFSVSYLESIVGVPLTTRTDLVEDAGAVDMGYHYEAGPAVRQYQLSIEVHDYNSIYGGNGRLEAQARPAGESFLDPNTIQVNQGAIVDLTAIPDPCYKVRSWSGTDNDDSNAATNTVMMNSDRKVVVAFEPDNMYYLTVTVEGEGTVWPSGRTLRTPGEVVTLTATPDNPTNVIVWTGTDNDYSQAKTNTVTMTDHKNVYVEFYSPRILYVGGDGDYPTIQLAIEDAYDRDIVMITPGTYNVVEASQGYPYLLIDGKDITLTSTSPENPEATSIIGKIVINEGVSRRCVIQGLTIRDSTYWGFDLFDTIEEWQMDDVEGSGVDGYPGAWAYGAGMTLWGNASPTVRNCIFLNCVARGVHASDGSGGEDPNRPFTTGNGGPGGRALGGGAYCGPYGSPLFENCRFTGCSARGGDGSEGAGGSDTYLPGHGGAWGNKDWYGWDYPPLDYWKYSGYGGAVYLDDNSTVEFVNCTFADNNAIGGSCGLSGLWPNGRQASGWPYSHYRIQSFGGAVYASTGSAPTFTNCVFINNTADINGWPTHLDGQETVEAYPTVSYGGAVAFEEGASPVFENCLFEENLATVGGAIWHDESFPDIINSSFVGNSALYGGAVLFSQGTSWVEGCRFINNEVTLEAGQGGAISSLGANAEIVDCNITGNLSAGEGGGIYLSNKAIDGNKLPNDNTILLKNCLVAGNSAVNNGGGISANWHSEPNIINCTIANNLALQGLGGGIYSGYNSYTCIINSILWGNVAQSGNQIAIGTTGDPAHVKITYSDVRSGAGLVRVDPGAVLEWDVALDDPAYPTNINADPLFASGPAGHFYLSQTSAGQSQTSPCVDAGSDLASVLGFSLYTTRTDEVLDRTIVDMGYHLPLLEPCRFLDLWKDGIINFYDFAILASAWLDEECGEPNSWCGGADLTFDGHVGIDDLALVTDCWLAQDINAPTPDPAQWEIEPYATSPNSVSMRAVESQDVLWGLPVDYNFVCVSGDCHDSGWQSDANYTDSGLLIDTEYSYKVKASDTMGNETEWSVVRYVTTTAGQGLDTTPPTPSPMTWATVPEAASATSVRMVATTATDASGVVAYEFNEPNLGSSGWRSDPCYVVTDIDPNTQYCFRVRARDAYNNVTTWSSEECASGATIDTNAPSPSPTMVILPDVNNIAGPDVNVTSGQFMYTTYPVDYRWWHKVIVNVAGITDDSGGPVEIRFICTTDDNFSSGSKIPAVIYIGQPVALGSRGQGWRLTYTGTYIVYDVDVDKIGGTGKALNWKACAYDAAFNEACSGIHKIGPP